MSSLRRRLAGRARFAALALALIVAMPTVLFVSSQLQSADDKRGALEQWVPANTFAFVSVPNLTAAQEAFKKTSLWKIWEDEEVKQALEPTREALDKQWEEFEKNFEETVGLKFDDAVEVLDGQVAFAVVDLPGTNDHGPEKLDVLFSLDVGDYRDRAEQLLTKGKEELMKQQQNLKEGSYDFKGFKVSTLGDEQLTMHYTFVGSTLLLGTQKATFENVITAANDGLPTCLASDPMFAKVRSTCGAGNENFLLYANVYELYAKYEPEMDEDAIKVISGLGLRDVKAVGAAVTLGGDDVKDVVYIHCPGPRKGIPKILSFTSAEPKDLSIVPQDAIAVSVINMDLAQAYDDVLDTVRHVAENNDWKEIEDGIAKAEEEVGFKFSELLSSFGTQFVSYSAFPEAGGVFPDSVMAVELRDAAKFEACIKAVVDKKKAEFRELPFQGETIHYMSRMEVPEEADREMRTFLSGYPLAYVIKGNTLYFSENTHALRRMILSLGHGGETVASNTLWRNANARLGAPQGVLVYYDFARLFNLGYNTVVPVAQYFQGFLSEAGIPLDIARLPLGETLGKYISQSITGISSDADGIKIESHSSIGLSVSGVFIAGVAAAVAIPTMSRERTNQNEMMASMRLRQVVSVQASWREMDPDANGVNDYAVASVWEMYGHKDANGVEVQYIEPSLAQADFGKLGVEAVPVSGYYFAMIDMDDTGAAYKDQAGSKFAVCAWPAAYGATGKMTYIVNEEGRIFSKDLGGLGKVEQWPGVDPTTDGWTESY